MFRGIQKPHGADETYIAKSGSTDFMALIISVKARFRAARKWHRESHCELVGDSVVHANIQ
jgi:hypothetical protein